jgi:hypothetical protein
MVALMSPPSSCIVNVKSYFSTTAREPPPPSGLNFRPGNSNPSEGAFCKTNIT